MVQNSAIEWTDHTFNPWVGCTKISPACDHCYAEGWAKRTGGAALWQGERRRTSVANWRQPIKWNQAAAFAGTRMRVFCASLADVFDNHVPAEWRDDLLNLIYSTPHLDWQLLTKRPQNIAKMLPAEWDDGWQNVWLGTTVADQVEADRNIKVLAAVPATLRFLSAEPLLDRIETPFLSMHLDQQGNWRLGGAIHWVIVGGESGRGARPMHPDWARSLRNQCQCAGVPFFFKQWGEWRDEAEATASHHAPGADMFDRYGAPVGPKWHPYEASDRNGGMMIRIGKKAAGALLDGQAWKQMPATLSPDNASSRG